MAITLLAKAVFTTFPSNFLSQISDSISFEKLEVALIEGQEAFHPRAVTDFEVSFKIRFSNDAPASVDDRQIVNFRVGILKRNPQI